MNIRNMTAGALSFIFVYAAFNFLMYGWEKTRADALMQTGVFGICFITLYIFRRIRKK